MGKIKNLNTEIPNNVLGRIETNVNKYDSVEDLDKYLEGLNSKKSKTKKNNQPKNAKIVQGARSVAQSDIKGVGNIFAPQIMINRKNNYTNSGKNNLRYVRRKPDKQADYNKAPTLNNYLEPKNVNFGNFSKCNTKPKCPDPNLSNNIAKNLKEKTYYPGYKYMPPNNWQGYIKKTPQCVSQQKCLTGPVLLQDTYGDPKEYTGIGSVLPRFSFQQEYEYPSNYSKEKIVERDTDQLDEESF